MHTLKAFSDSEFSHAKLLLATQVASMMGRKFEEDDWNKVYCAAKRIPHSGWSNLNIDVNHGGLGVEQKLLRVSGLGARPIKSVCGTTMMHPAATRSIRIDNTEQAADDTMRDVFRQYTDLIELRTQKVREQAPAHIETDMRLGWLLWEDSLMEFLYFEQPWEIPEPDRYYAEWNVTPAKGARKASKSLWIYERDTDKKRYSVTTSAGIKIQPYFDVPAPSDENLYYFRVQSEPIDYDTVKIWISGSTARALQRLLGDLDKETVSTAIIQAAQYAKVSDAPAVEDIDFAKPILINMAAFQRFQSAWDGVSDEHRAQLFLESLHERPPSSSDSQDNPSTPHL
ncbi:hypothetical protein [uncultured Thiocystis sp.]|jgi:hypothetical protein|uniref:hypothetical protein n=1 Tax=uncultured Thiocystis sp. TaxID=1202134 RepID=UPI0025F372C2|nr:hypothetical protein [uncultured Thiocystis sp.]